MSNINHDSSIKEINEALKSIGVKCVKVAADKWLIGDLEVTTKLVSHSFRRNNKNLSTHKKKYCIRGFREDTLKDCKVIAYEILTKAI